MPFNELMEDLDIYSRATENGTEWNYQMNRRKMEFSLNSMQTVLYAENGTAMVEYEKIVLSP